MVTRLRGTPEKECLCAQTWLMKRLEVVDGRGGMEIKKLRRAPGVQEPVDDDQRYLRELDLSLS
jgi:hypothetical protein